MVIEERQAPQGVGRPLARGRVARRRHGRTRSAVPKRSAPSPICRTRGTRRRSWTNSCGPSIKARSRPESSITFGAFVETQWKALVLPTFKASTQHGYKTVLDVHVLPAWRDWRLRDIERLAIQQWVADKFRQRHRLADGAECVGAALEHSRNGGRIRVSAGEPGAGREVPAEGLKEKPAMIAGDDFAKLLEQLERTVSDDGESHRRDGTADRRAAGAAVVGARSRRSARLAVRESVFEGKFQPPKTQKALRTIPLGPHAVAGAHGTSRARRRRHGRTISCSAIARASRCGSRSC